MLLLACASVLALLVIAPAGAKPKGAVVPKVGDYTGHLKVKGGKAPATGIVEKLGDEYFVGLNPANPVEVTCGGKPVSLTVYASAEVEGGKFKVTAKIQRPAEIANKSVTVTMTGSFATPTRASGTISAKTVAEPGVEGSVACHTGNLKFQLVRG